MNKVVRRKCNRRTGWTDGLTEKETSVPGARLMQMLLTKANEQGLQLRELATKLGVTAGYLHQLRTGRKPMTGISSQIIENMKIFLGVPRISVLLASGIVKIEDCYPEPDILSIYLRQGVDFIRHDPVWGPLVPAHLENPEEDMLMFIIKLYEEATGRKILPQRNEEAWPLRLTDLLALTA
ncbi:hypothetical protein HER14_08380 [Acidithiobacillus thiooxidans]|uniref:Uncharacterized protein n=3 Tax=Acidithiobacillus thiooxidans TaxID=930 RepID=A0A1C2HZD8_ACITH|nr:MULTISPECIES: hypothetical protein [Acidithiobacillus]MBU2742959.1 hypothetical protein [Acidithiobacillus albertensis]MBU2750949.1 hypothetical protein [Acidithiobacillus thiooxidans]MBU2792544.1 hypothetical protein [Acidithiobacillus thiooxidans]MBU2836523.1 hypothetical protein [Acidithiobacillus thiooxidans]OCX69128.1 hypothetical protein A6M23_15955 [Acidithiobacillus thiooxidans]